MRRDYEKYDRKYKWQMEIDRFGKRAELGIGAVAMWSTKH